MYWFLLCDSFPHHSSPKNTRAHIVPTITSKQFSSKCLRFLAPDCFNGYHKIILIINTQVTLTTLSHDVVATAA